MVEYYIRANSENCELLDNNSVQYRTVLIQYKNFYIIRVAIVSEQDAALLKLVDTDIVSHLYNANELVWIHGEN